MTITYINALNFNYEKLHNAPYDESYLPSEVLQLIFKELKTDLPSLALVSKRWQVIVDDESFYRHVLRPSVNAFGVNEWKEYMDADIGMTAEAEPRLPRCVYNKKEGFLTLIPEKVKILNENHEIPEVPFYNFKIIKKLVTAPKKGHVIDFKGVITWDSAPDYKFKLMKSHWVWIMIQAEDMNKHLERINSHRTFTIDLIASILLEYVRWGESHFSLESGEKIQLCEIEGKYRIYLIFKGINWYYGVQSDSSTPELASMLPKILHFFGF
jgi:hypothetical protein